MSLPTGKYGAVLLWATRRQSGNGWDMDFILTATGERDKAFVFSKDIGFVVAPSKMILRGGKYQPRNLDEEQPIVVLDLQFSPKYDSTRIVKSTDTRLMMAVDTRFTGKTFEPEDF